MAQAGGYDKSFKAGADLNTTTSDFQPVYVNSAGSVRIANSTTHKVIGILQNRPKSGTGAACVVRSVGYSKITVNDTCTAGDQIVMGSGGALRGSGLSITAATSRYIVGDAIETSGASGTVIEIFLRPSIIAGTLSAAID
ncbi:MAG: hypothetical protein QME32_00275 [Endomicrobiia bacterium]|nr:hypothetical protein [Endomicrobiia bacterium]